MDTTHLKKRRQTWFVRVTVPEALRARVGKREYVCSLKTRDLAVARQRRHSELARINAELAQHAKEAAAAASDSVEALVAFAESQREAVARGEQDERTAETLVDIERERLLDAAAKARGIDPETGHPRLPPDAERKVRLSSRVLKGTDGDLVSRAVTAYLASVEDRITKAGFAQKKRQLEAFAKWAGADAEVSDLKRKLTGRYTATVVQPAELSTKTKKDWLANLSAFGSWLENLYGLEGNPWRNQTRVIRENSRGGVRKRKRSYTMDELAALIGKLPGGDPLLPLVCIGAYSGMRIDEIASLKVEDVKGNALHVVRGKNENSVRYVPIHPVIRGMIDKLAATSRDGYLISGLLAGGADAKRSHNVSKRFGQFLRRHEFSDGEVDFHSLRRTFIQRLESAQVPLSTAELIVGHARQSLTFGLYSEGPEFAVIERALQQATYGKQLDAAVRKLAESCTITKKSAVRYRARKAYRKATSGEA